MELISQIGLSGCKPSLTPLEVNKKLTSIEYDLQVGPSDDPKIDDILGYQKLVGKLLYLTITRPDICFAVQTLSQFMQRPKQSHMDGALRVVRYLKGNPELGILLKADEIISMTAFCDSDWVSYPNTRRSVSGYIVMMGDSLVSWKSKKQHTVSRS
ncbi:uncharacterized mitochondrial protein AtMg00810-like [Capsicum annuum]|uniref:uncharacterized mitochondrial protein AtMg00810-like n=1 Tax=Capsicum annuum TaxID=4072 RepID=UPI0007BF2D38|nr:uncharacterized mitochondrial protein AtMg00810-like [Capsicum annuum]